tara:strand:- start:2235 stop:3881 length:1647 start_codon:yes stop_codon:yes gene_type:complete
MSDFTDYNQDDEDEDDDYLTDEIEEQERLYALSLKEADSFNSVYLPNFAVNAGSDFQDFYKDDENYSAFDDLFPHQTEKENEAAAFFNTPDEAETGSLNTDSVDNWGSIRYPSNIRDTVSTGRRASDSTLSPNPEGDDSLLMPEIDEALFGDQYNGIIPDLGVAKTRKGFVPTGVVDPNYEKSSSNNRGAQQPSGIRNSIGLGGLLGVGALIGNNNDNNDGIIIPAINTNTPTSTTPTTTPQNTNMQKPGELKDFKHYLNQAKDTFTDEDFLNDILNSEKNLAPGFIDQRTDNINRSYEGYGGVATDAIGSVGDATTAANQRAREGGAQFFQDTYGKTIDNMRAGNRGLYDMVDSQSKQANMLGEKAMGLMENAGKLTERQRYGIEDGTRARMQQMGRGTSNFALEQELGNVIEAERLDANRDYATAGGMLGQQAQISGMVSGMEQPYVQQVFNQKVDPYAGLTLAESSKGLGQNVGPTMFDVGSLYGAAQGDYNQQSNLYLANKNAKAQKDSNFWNSAAGFGDMIGIDDYLERKLAEYNTPVEEEKG